VTGISAGARVTLSHRSCRSRRCGDAGEPTPASYQ